MRRLRIVCVLAVIGASVLLYSLPKLAAQSSSTGASSSAFTVVASGIAVRTVALASVSAPAENSARPDIFLTGADQPSRVLVLAGTIRGAAGTTLSPNLTVIAGGGGAGSLGDGGTASAAQLNLKLDSLFERSGVAVAPDGTIFIADTRNATIRRIAGASASDAGVIRSVAGKWAPAQNVQLAEPMGIALDRAGNLYIADHTANAVIELHEATSTGGGRLEVIAHVSQAASIAVTADGGRIFVAAPEAGNVFVIETQTRAISQILGATPLAANSASHTVGCVSSGVVNGSQSPCPSGIAIDGGGNLFVADAAGNRILRFDALTQKTAVTAIGIATPGEIVFDASGNLFIAEQGRNRISEIQGLGQPVSSVTLTPPPPPVPPAGTPCPAIVPPPGFSSVINYCAEPLAGATPTAAFTVTNGTNSDLTNLIITTIGLNPGDFVNSSTSCTSTLRANSTCIINLAFAPTGSGTRRATLGVTYTGATTPLAAAVAGTGEDYQITLASGQLTEISVAAGDKATFMLQLVPDNIFTGTINFVCPGNMPAQTTCSFSPGSSLGIPVPGTAVPFSVTFQTTSRVATKTAVPAAPGKNNSGRRVLAILMTDRLGGKLAVGVVVIFCLFAFMLRVPPQRLQLLSSVSMFALFLVVAAILVGCHSSGTPPVIGTPAGTNKMTVQGATQGAARGITVTLDVE